MPPSKRVRSGRGSQAAPVDQETVNTMLQDFDRQWAKRVADMEKDDEDFFRSLRAHGKMLVLKMSKEDREVKATELFSCLHVNSPKKEERKDEQEVVDSLDQQIEEVRQEVRLVARQQQQQHQQHKASSKASRTASKASKTPMMAPPPSTCVRRSTRKRIAPAPFETPMGRRHMGMGGMGMPMSTPMATPVMPKFDLTTPVPRSLMRVMKPNETAMSMNGSPLYALASSVASRGAKGRKKEEESVQIPLGKGKTMVLPLGADGQQADGVSAKDLDEEQRQKLRTIHATLEKMFQFKD